MDADTLVKQFGKDPESVFLDVIRTSPGPIRTQSIKAQVIEAGVEKADVDRRWTPFQRGLRWHPQITSVNGTYRWSADPESARISLDVLAGHLLKKLPPWVAQPLVQNVAVALNAEATAPGSASPEFEAARLVANLAMAVEVLQSRGETIAEVAKLLTDETRRKRLWPLGQPGETLPFDPDSHDPEVQAPHPGTVVRIVRSGYTWRGGGEPIVAAKAIVAL